MTHGIVSYVVNDLEVVHSMEGHSAIVSLMDGIVASIRLVHCADHVEMDRVATQLESLADIRELDVLNPSNDGLVTR